ncbi:uncharacterized protein BKA55DRAFT_478428, partial [Fusarium redolens]
WVGNFKKRHPELQCNRPKVKEIQRASAETDIPRMEGWFGGYEGTVIREEIPIFNSQEKNTRPVAFQPGNKESMTAVDAINAIGQAIPSFLI